MKKLIESMLVAYFKSKNLMEDGPVIDQQSFFDTLEFNWALILKNALNNK